MKFAWIENGTVRDTCVGNPTELFVADIAAFFDTEVDNGITPGATLVDGVWTNPTVPEPVVEPVPEPVVEPVPEPAPIVYPTVSAIEYKMLFTVGERIAIKTSTDPVVMDIYELLNDPRVTVVNLNLKSIQDALDYFVSIDLLTAERVAVILKGTLEVVPQPVVEPPVV